MDMATITATAWYSPGFNNGSIIDLNYPDLVDGF